MGLKSLAEPTEWPWTKSHSTTSCTPRQFRSRAHTSSRFRGRIPIFRRTVTTRADMTMFKDPERANLVQWTFSGDYDAEKPILIDSADPTRVITKNKALQLVASLNGAFAQDSTVCLHLANDITYPILCLAIWASKCRWTGTNPGYTAPELEHHFRVSKTKYVVTSEDKLDTVRSAVQASGTDAEIVLFSDILSEDSDIAQDHDAPEYGLRNLHDLLGPGTPEEMFQTIADIDTESLATLCPTSGTTGLPKMAAHTHRATVLESAATQDAHDAKPYAIRRLFCTPIFHSFSTPEMVVNSLRIGTPSYFMKRFDDNLFPKAIQDFGITEIFAPPPILLRLINNPASHAMIQSLRNIYSGGAPLVPELRAKFDALFQDPPRITVVWGMTEGGWFTTNKYDMPDETNSCGRPIQGYEVTITQKNATEVDGHQAGEIYVRGPALMKCYFGNATASADAFDGEWLKTGDVGYLLDGKVFLIDRSKDLVKVNGFQVAPAEIENALLTSADVKDCGVISAGHDVNEHPLAFVVLANDLVTTDELKKHLRGRLASYKCSTIEIRFVREIPKSISGKILKKELRKMAAE